MLKNTRELYSTATDILDEWLEEAARRGLPNCKSVVDSVYAMTEPRTIKMFKDHGVLTEVECASRAEIAYESYTNRVLIEARTMIDMAAKQIKPAVIAYAKTVADTVSSIETVCADSSVERELLTNITANIKALDTAYKKLSEAIAKSDTISEVKDKAMFVKDEVFTAMGELRAPADELEMLVDEEYWPFPTYGDILFYV